MHSAVRAVALSTFVVAAAACGGDSPVTTQPTVPPGSVVDAGTPLENKIRAQIDTLSLDATRRAQAQQSFTTVVAARRGNDVPLTGTRTDALMQLIVDAGKNALIRDPDGPDGPRTPATGMVGLFDDLYLYTGLTQFVTGATSSSTLVLPSDQDQIIDSELGMLAFIPGGSLTEGAVLYIERKEEGGKIDPGFVTVSELYDARFVPEIAFDEVTIGICVYPSTPTGSQLAHGLSTGEIEILAPVDAPLFCDGEGDEDHDHASADRAGGGPLRVLADIGRRALRLFTPTIAYAGHAALAGTVRELSPFQVINTATELTTSIGPVTYGGVVEIEAMLGVPDATTGLPGRSLSLLVDGVALDAVETDAGGVARWSMPADAAGTFTFEIGFAGETTALGRPKHDPATVAGSYTVERAALTLATSSATVPFGETIPSCTVTYSGLVNGDTPASIGTVATCTYPTTAGASVVNPTALAPANYQVSVNAGTFIYQYADGSGYFIPPVTYSQAMPGTTHVVRFRLASPNGQTPYVGRAITLRVANDAGFARALGPLAPTGTPGEYEATITTTGWPLGLSTLIADLDDGTTRSIAAFVR